MPSDRPDIGKRYIKIDDFTLGIYSTYWSAASERSTFKKNGAATIENTYYCCANPDGVLGPLPRPVTTQTEANLWAGTGTLTGTKVRITDCLVTGPVTWLTSNNVTTQEAGSFISVAFSFKFTPTAGAYGDYQFVRRYDNIPIFVATQDIFLSKYTTASNESRPGIILGEGRTDIGVAANPPIPTVASVAKLIMSLAGHGNRGVASFARSSGTLSATDQTAFPNYYAQTRQQYSATEDDNILDQVGALWVYPGKAADIYLRTVPRPMHQTVGTLTATETTSFHDYVFHQGRVVGYCYVGGSGSVSDSAIFATSGGIATFLDDVIAYTKYPDWVVQDAQPSILLASTENTTSYGAIGSINANELLLIKNSGGGVVVRGDLDNPTISQLPYLESTFGMRAHGCNTPLGFVYGSRNGVFVWAGGETSEKLSQQIDGLFWNDWTDSTSYNSSNYQNVFGIEARFSYWHPWVVVPNGYFFDIRSNSWWRYEIPSTEDNSRLAYAYSDIEAVSGNLVSAPWAMDRAGSPPASVVYAMFKQTSFRTSYSWQSQPLLESELVLNEYDEIVLIAQRQDDNGDSTVLVTLTGFNEDGSAVTPATCLFTLASNMQVQMIRQAIGVGGATVPFVAKGVQMRIETDDTGLLGAPLVHDVWLGISTQFGEHPLVS